MWDTLASFAENYRTDAEQCRAQEWWQDRTFLDDLTVHGTKRPNHPAVIACEGGKLARETNCEHLAVLVERFAGLLARRGAGRGDVVVIYVPD